MIQVYMFIVTFIGSDTLLFISRSLIFASLLTSCTSPTCLLRPRNGRAVLVPILLSRRVHPTYSHHVLNDCTVCRPNLLFHVTLPYKVAMTTKRVTARKKSRVMNGVMKVWVSDLERYLENSPKKIRALIG